MAMVLTANLIAVVISSLTERPPSPFSGRPSAAFQKYEWTVLLAIQFPTSSTMVLSGLNIPSSVSGFSPVYPVDPPRRSS
jgi:hypothetical protein